MDQQKNALATYDSIANWYSENRSKSLMEQPYLDLVIKEIGDHGTVLDLGCGTGEPIIAYLLQQGMGVTGVDGSQRMLDIATLKFPDTEFVCQDMRYLLLNKKFDAIIMWHSLFHLPQEDQPALFGLLKAHLNFEGVLMFTSGNKAGEVWSVNGGENLFHASLNTEQYRALLLQNGFEIVSHVKDDPKCGGATVWLAKLIA